MKKPAIAGLFLSPRPVDFVCAVSSDQGCSGALRGGNLKGRCCWRANIKLAQSCLRVSWHCGKPPVHHSIGFLDHGAAVFALRDLIHLVDRAVGTSLRRVCSRAAVRDWKAI